jgi:putative MATE family efflux protein
MHDLTEGPISRHIVVMAVPIAIGMLFQTLYYLVDLYFVAQLGDAAIAGVGAAGNVQFIIMALTQALGVGTMALIAHAIGRKDFVDANLVFNQGFVLSAGCALLVLAGGYALSGLYLRSLAADAQTAAAGAAYLHAFLPGLALQFALVTMGATLRGTGIVKPTMLVQMITVILNALLAPVLIAGWLTGHAFGVAGAGLASSISVAVGVVLMGLYFARLEKVVGFDPGLMRVRLATWARILRVGLPPGGEFALMFVYMGVIYWVIRGFGADAQAGFGVGSRVMQAIFLPAMAVAFAVAPVAGQNFGAGNAARVRATFRIAAIMGSALMLVLTLLCQVRPDWLVRGFTDDPAVIDVAAEFLRIISLNFVATGLVFTCSGMFQAVGNTLPSLASSATRLLTFAVPAILLAGHPGFGLRELWTLSVCTVALQAATSLWLLHRELGRRLAVGLSTA